MLAHMVARACGNKRITYTDLLPIKRRIRPMSAKALLNKTSVLFADRLIFED